MESSNLFNFILHPLRYGRFDSADRAVSDFFGRASLVQRRGEGYLDRPH